MKLIDTHCHLFLSHFAQRASRDVALRTPDEIVRSANEAGVKKLIIIGTNEEDCRKNIDYAQRKDGVYTAVGIHPDELTAGESVDEKVEFIKKILNEPKVVAIGEIGLDFYRSRANEKEQTEFLEKILPFAVENNIPVIFHFRNVLPEATELLKKYAGKLNAVLHCYTEDLAFAEQVIEWGYKISYTNIIGYPKNDQLREVVNNIDLKHIMLETDAPFLPPASRRGQICEPSDVVEVAKTVAEVKGISVEVVAEITTQNAVDFFGLE